MILTNDHSLVEKSIRLISYFCDRTRPLSASLFILLILNLIGCKADLKSTAKPIEVSVPIVPPLSEAQIKFKYENCVGGWYSGPRPGKTRFTQDPWIWVVTPEFAERFCMPAEFISTELKGAEAVAFKVLRKADGVNCGFANNPAACFGEPMIRFDIYIKSTANLPVLHKLPIYHVPDMPSMRMISRSPLQRAAELKYVTEHPVPYGYPHFQSQQVVLQGIKNEVVEWPVTGLGEQEHRAEIFEGIDYYSFEGLSGAFQNDRMLKLKINDFQITFKKSNEVPRQSLGRNKSEFPYSIEFPKKFSALIIENDIKYGRNFSQEIRDAFIAKTTPPISK